MKTHDERPFPVLTSLQGYRADWLPRDISAGLAIAAVGLPSAIAYPAIAGLPPETGFYASIAPLVAYAIFGPSRQLIVGPDAATMTVLAAVLVTIYATPGVWPIVLRWQRYWRSRWGCSASSPGRFGWGFSRPSCLGLS